MKREEIEKRYFDYPWCVPGYFLKNVIDKKKYIPCLCEDFTEEEWREFLDSFVGKIIRKKNGVSSLNKIVEALGFIPTYEDLTDKEKAKINFEKIHYHFERTLASNTIGNYFAIIKSILIDRDLDFPIEYKRFKQELRVRKEDSQSIYLSEKELDRFEQEPVLDDRELYSKKIFMISALSGMRHSDSIRMDESYVQNGVLTYNSEKTNITASIPCGERLMKWLKLKIDSVSSLSEFVLNDNLKNICRRAGITEELTLYRAGKNEKKPKCDFVSMHTSRRSFCTNLYLRGMDVKVISRLAGHTNVDMTWRYIKADRPMEDKFLDFFK